MKKIFLIIICFCSLRTIGQIRCVAENKYRLVTTTSDKQVNKNFILCFNDEYFSFMCPDMGVGTFKIDQVYNKLNDEGYNIESFFNEEEGTTPRAMYDVRITYGIKKEILFTNTISGEACYLICNGFVGSPPNNSLADKAKKAIVNHKPAPPKSKTIVQYYDMKGRDSIFENGDIIRVRFIGYEYRLPDGRWIDLKEYLNRRAKSLVPDSMQGYRGVGLDIVPVIDSLGQPITVGLDKNGIATLEQCFIKNKQKFSEENLRNKILALILKSGVKWKVEKSNERNVKYVGKTIQIVLAVKPD